MSLGKKIRELQIAKGLTQSDLGSGLVTPSIISQIESDKANPSYKVLEAIAAKLETPLEHFLVDVQTQMERATAYKVGRALFLAGKVEKASDVFQQLLDSPVQPQALKCYIEMEILNSAAELLDSVLDLPDAHILLRANKLRGDVEYKRKKFSKAVVFYEKSLETFSLLPWPEPTLQASVLQQLGKIYEGFGEIYESVTYFEQACKYLKGGHDPSQTRLS